MSDPGMQRRQIENSLLLCARKLDTSDKNWLDSQAFAQFIDAWHSLAHSYDWNQDNRLDAHVLQRVEHLLGLAPGGHARGVDGLGMMAETERRRVGRPAQLESGEAWAGVKRLYDRVLHDVDAEEANRLLSGAASNARPALGMKPATGDVIDPFTCVHGLYWLTANLGKERPLLISLDDVQWLDEPSAKWLAHMVSRAGDLPLVLAFARRTGERVAAPTALAEILGGAYEAGFRGQWTGSSPTSRGPTASAIPTASCGRHRPRGAVRSPRSARSVATAPPNPPSNARRPSPPSRPPRRSSRRSGR